MRTSSQNSKRNPAARGQNLALPGGSLPENIPPYLLNLIAKTGGHEGPIGRQFIARPNIEQKFYSESQKDPLIERENEVAPGLIYKYRGKIGKDGKVLYYGRVLWTISRFCAAYCRFCTRGRLVGLPASRQLKGETMAQKPYLDATDIQKTINFIKKHREINEVILSGGDPLIVPEQYLTTILQKLTALQQNGNLDFIRIHTRAPITNPASIQSWHFEQISKIKNPYVVLHVNHPLELTPEARKIITTLHDKKINLLSQTVLLRGVNDSVETLSQLFTELAKNGIHPYYLHQNDPVYWAKDFTVPWKRAIKIWQKLRPRLSGIAATAKFVIDTPFGYGKVPVPEAGWDVDYSHFRDFRKNPISLK